MAFTPRAHAVSDLDHGMLFNAAPQSPDDLFQVKSSYLFKPPRKDYHLTRPYVTRDGEIKRRVRGRLAGPANCVRSWRELKNRTLDELTFGRGDGARVFRKVRQQANQLLSENLKS